MNYTHRFYLTFLLAFSVIFRIQSHQLTNLAASLNVAFAKSNLITHYSENARNPYNNLLLQYNQKSIPHSSIAKPQQQQFIKLAPVNLKSPQFDYQRTTINPKTSPILESFINRGNCIQNQNQIQITTSKFSIIQEARQSLIKNQVYTALSILKQSNFFKSPHLAVNAQNLSDWKRLNTLKISSPEPNRLLQKLISEIQKSTMDSDCFYKPLSKEDQKFHKLIKSFEKQVIWWLENDYMQNISDIDANSFVQHHAATLEQLTPTEISSFAQDPINWHFLDSYLEIYDQELRTKIFSSSTYKKLCAAENACQKGDFQEASQIIAAIPQNFAQYAATENYKQYFFEKHLSDGIDKKLSDHPDYLKRQAELKPLYNDRGLIVPHPFNTELTRNSKLYQQIIKDMGIANPSESLKNLIYEKLIPLIKSPHTDNPQIKNAAIDAIEQNIKELNRIASSENIKQSSHYQIINRIENAYNAMQQGNTEAKNYLERGLLSGINNNILALDHDKQAEFFEKVGLKAEFQQWKSCQDRNTIAQSLHIKEFKVYEFPAHILQLLKDHNLTIEDYSQLYGNGLQHFNHVDFIKQLDAQSQLRQKVTDKALTKLTHLSTQITENARAANASSDVQQAMILSNFNWKIINFVKEAAIFCFDINKEVLFNVGRATLDAAHGLYDTVTHPITSFENTVRGLVHLTDTAITIVDIADTKLHDITYGTADKNQLQVLQDLGRQSKELVSSVIDYGQKEGVPRLVGKAAYAATSFAWDTAITGKSIQLMNKFAKIAQSKEMGQFLQKAANALNKVPELEAVTAEGLKVAVPKGAELCALSEAGEAITKGTRVSPIVSSVTETTIKHFSSQAIDEGIKYATSPAKIKHIFDKARHNLDPLVKKLGGIENTILRVLNEANGKLPSSGIFKDILVPIEGYDVYIRGSIVDGIPKLGTMFIK